MSRKLLLLLLAVILVPSSVSLASPVEITRAVTWHDSGMRSDIGLSLRLIGGKGSVVTRGRDINLTFQTDRDAYVIIYNIDSEGVVQLLYPADGVPRLARKGKVYFLPEQGKGIKWEVAGKTGIEYIQALAVKDAGRIDREELRFLAGNYDAPADKQLKVDMDPLLAANLLNEDIVRDADEQPIATDYTYFYINREVDYPRYLCDKCHTGEDISDPYAMDCPEIFIEEMLYDDEDLHYPYPAQFVVKKTDEEEGGYFVSSDYADNITSDWDDEDYYEDEDSKVYLSIYYTDHDYPYRFDYPGWRSWYYTNYDPWYWNYGPYDWGFSFSWNWGNYYYHHWPFHSWYSHNYYAYNMGCYYGWHPYHSHWNHHGGWYHNDHYYHKGYNKRSIYAGRSFQKRSLDYAVASSRSSRINSLRESRLTNTRTRDVKRRVDPSRARDARYIAGGTAGTARARRPKDATSARVVPSRVIYRGDGTRAGKTGTTRRTRLPDTPARPTADGGGRRLEGDRKRGRDTGTTTRGRTWGRKRSSDSSTRKERRTTGAGRGKETTSGRTTKRRSYDSRDSSTRKSETKRSTRSRGSTTGKSSRSGSSGSSTRKSTPAKSPKKTSTRKSSSSSKRSPSSSRKSSSSKSSSARSSRSSRKSPPARSSSSRSSSSSSKSSGSSRSSSKSGSSRGKRR